MTVKAICEGKKNETKGLIYRYADDMLKKQENEPDPESLRDSLDYPVSPGDPVMFILTTVTETPRLLMGKVRELTQYSVVVDYFPDGSKRIRVPYDDPFYFTKVLVLRPRPERKLEGDLDASGYPIREGDPVAYLPPLSGYRTKGFKFGTAELIKGKYWEINGTRRTPDRIVVVNWEEQE